jgi:hypothetical protein
MGTWQLLEQMVREGREEFAGDPSKWHGQPELQQRLVLELDKLREEMDSNLRAIEWMVKGERLYRNATPDQWSLVLWATADELKKFNASVQKIAGEYQSVSPETRRAGFRAIPGEGQEPERYTVRTTGPGDDE